MIAQEVTQKVREIVSRSQPVEVPAENDLIRRRVIECFAITMIGDGALGFIEPVRHIQLWLRGPSWWRKMMQPFADSPELTRWVAAAEFGLGIWLAIRQEPEV